MIIDKQALREEFRFMQVHYSDPADRAHQVIYIAAEALLDENLQLQREKDATEAVALALRDDMRQAREQLAAAERRIAELEARTVVVKQFDDFQIVHYGATEDYAKGYIDCQSNYNKAIYAAGIKVKGE
ncbi:ead/Ea22-like family protein [Salmonella enterica]|nr:ead/Ea22-like family protein [Salmonella enterica]